MIDYPDEGRLPDTVPPMVQALADQVHMTPIAWHIHPDKIVIVFEQGPKLTFDRDDLAVKVIIAPKEPPVGAKHVSPAPISPAIQKLPVKRQAKSK